MNTELKRILAGLNDLDLAAVNAEVKSIGDSRRAAFADSRRAAFDLNDIKPGMKPEDMAHARAEIARLMAEAQG